MLGKIGKFRAATKNFLEIPRRASYLPEALLEQKVEMLFQNDKTNLSKTKFRRSIYILGGDPRDTPDPEP